VPANLQPFTLLAADKLAAEGLDYINAQADGTLLERSDLADLKKDQGQEAVDVELGKLLAAGGVDAMIVRSGIKVTPAVLENPGDLKIIARAGVGVDNIDLKAATDKGILVVNTAEASTITTAEHAFALMMALLRNVGPAYKTMAGGGWDRNKYKGRQLHGMTLGVVGLGRIGRTVAERALAFGMEVVGYDPFVSTDLQLGEHTVRTFRDFKETTRHSACAARACLWLTPPAGASWTRPTWSPPATTAAAAVRRWTCSAKSPRRPTARCAPTPRFW